MRFIHNFGILAPCGLNQDSLSCDLRARTLACFYARIFKFSKFQIKYLYLVHQTKFSLSQKVVKKYIKPYCGNGPG